MSLLGFGNASERQCKGFALAGLHARRGGPASLRAMRSGQRARRVRQRRHQRSADGARNSARFAGQQLARRALLCHGPDMLAKEPLRWRARVHRYGAGAHPRCATSAGTPAVSEAVQRLQPAQRAERPRFQRHAPQRRQRQREHLERVGLQRPALEALGPVAGNTKVQPSGVAPRRGERHLAQRATSITADLRLGNGVGLGADHALLRDVAFHRR
mmetsp:Transcript_77802/g.218031  ORF Transcript_77802/g.218031 Transcript_77802/m.218031 type:complete len:215 (-) Transcript_77802:295-939(-)